MPEHNHSMQYYEQCEPTCEEEGNVAYWECSECQKRFGDPNGDTEIADVTFALSDEAVNAEYLTDTYLDYHWIKS